MRFDASLRAMNHFISNIILFVLDDDIVLKIVLVCICFLFGEGRRKGGESYQTHELSEFDLSESN